MAKYFLDFEFHEGFHKPLFGRKRHFIDVISFGMVCEDGREYYAISNEFDIKAAWNSFQMEQVSGDSRNLYPNGIKKYWLRDNVLQEIFRELRDPAHDFTFKQFKHLVKLYGKSNKQIANEIFQFVCPYEMSSEYAGVGSIDTGAEYFLKANQPEFYGYYADYDWVAFCSLFGKMIDLPNGFPWYCRDLKQVIDDVAQMMCSYGIGTHTEGNKKYPDNFSHAIEMLKASPFYPVLKNEHNALDDAKWNAKLFSFLQNCKK